jgi:hypothetical protein
MNASMLSKVLRDHAQKVREEMQPSEMAFDTSELINVLARLIEGKPIAKAFGAPGDWGYSTAIGKALASPAAATTAEISDTDRINWLEARPLPAEMRGGSDDGAVATFWGISAFTGTLRETLDHMIKTGSEQRKAVEPL